jgi:NTE family protein
MFLTLRKSPKTKLAEPSPRRRAVKNAPGSDGVALVLSGGGARGAYEVGALSVLLPALEKRGEAPTQFIGTSVGAINAAGLGAIWHLGAEQAVATVMDIWRQVDKNAVIRPILSWQVPITALRYAGGVLSVPRVRVPSLLDPGPLRNNLGRWIDWPQLHKNVRDGVVESVGIVATAAGSGRTVVFAEGSKDVIGAATEHRSHVISYVSTKLGGEHVSASAAIPIFFPPIHVASPRSAAGWYIDGGTRLAAPLKPALDLGAKRIVVVGMDAVGEPAPHSAGADTQPPDFGDGWLHVLQGQLVDPLIEDMRMLGNANLFFGGGDGAANAYRAARGKAPYRVVPYIFIAPSQAGVIGKLASDVFKANYGGLGEMRGIRGWRRLSALRGTDFRLLNRLLGDESPTHGELLSYLFFDRDFIDELIKMGAEDARRWMEEAPGPTDPWQIDPLSRFIESSVPTERASTARTRARTAA